MTTTDTIRALFTYLIALVVVVGGGAVLFFSRAESTSSDLRVVVAGFIGSALTFVFGQEVQTRTARQAASQTAAATVTATNGGSGGH
jgi:class 3 adenylate cyclase